MNKKFFLTGLLTAVFAAATLLPLPAAMAAEAVAASRTITVTGQAEISMTPDIAVATFGVTTAGASVEAAKRDNDRAMQNILDSLLAAGLEKSQVQTATFSVQPVYTNDRNGIESNSIAGYRVQNTISVTMEDISKVSQVIDIAFNAGANQFQGIRFSVKKEDSLKDNLIRQALLDGKRKAAMMAETLDAKLGRPVSVQENGQFSTVMFDSVQIKRVAASTPIAAGSLTASATVTLVFELE